MPKTLREWRVERMLTQRGLADAIGAKGHATIAGIEAGKRIPRMATMQRIADALGVEVRDVTEFADALERMASGSQRRPQTEA